MILLLSGSPAVRLALVAGAMMAGAVALAGPALAEESTGARVTEVEGRTVTITIPIPPDSALEASATLRANVEVDRRMLPARPELPVPDDRSRAVVMVLDTSGSMSGAFMAGARQAAAAYLDALPPDVEAGLVTFADQPKVSAPVGTLHGEIESSLAQARSSGGTSLYDAVRQGLELIPDDAVGRLLVLTDGEDNASASTLMGAARAARQQKVAVDVVLLGSGSRVVAEELAVAGAVTSATDARTLVRSFEEAALTVAPKVTVKADIPDDLDAAGAPATVGVTGDGGSVTATVVLPEVDSLRGPDAREEMPSPDVEESVISVPSAPRTVGEAESRPPLAVAALFGLAAAGLVIGTAWVIQSAVARRRRRRRVADVLAYGDVWPRSGGGSGTLPARRSAIDAWDQRLVATRRGRALQARLAAADLALGPSAWLITAGLTVLVATLLLWLVLGRLWLALVIALVVVPLAFVLVLRARIGRRQRAFSDELPEFLLLLSSALRAGLSFTQGLESAAEQHAGQVGRQIRRALAETQVSANLDEALLASADRMANDDLRWVVMALSVQREVGGNLSVILDSAAATIKGRHALAREVRALSAEGRLSAYVLLALPVGVFLFLLMFRREYVSQLWTHPLGIAMMIALVILMVVGWIWMRAVVRIRV